MNLHEYQGKELLAGYGVAVQRGFVAENVDQAVEAFKRVNEELGSQFAVVKAQIHAGGRGKGGGVKLVKNLDELKAEAGSRAAPRWSSMMMARSNCCTGPTNSMP